MNPEIHYPPEKMTASRQTVSDGLFDLGEKFQITIAGARAGGFKLVPWTELVRRDIQIALRGIPGKYRAWALRHLRGGCRFWREQQQRRKAA